MHNPEEHPVEWPTLFGVVGVDAEGVVWKICTEHPDASGEVWAEAWFGMGFVKVSALTNLRVRPAGEGYPRAVVYRPRVAMQTLARAEA